jgi:hypothetical protein
MKSSHIPYTYVFLDKIGSTSSASKLNNIVPFLKMGTYFKVLRLTIVSIFQMFSTSDPPIVGQHGTLQNAKSARQRNWAAINEKRISLFLFLFLEKA